MNKLLVIEKENLPELKRIYDVLGPKYIATTIAIDHFIKRFDKKPEWTKLVKFVSLNEDNWKQTGTFVLINEHDNQLLFNTLESAPYESLHTILDILSYGSETILRFPDVFLDIVLDVICRHNLELISSVGMKSVYLKVTNIPKIEAPDGFYFDSLNQSHVEQIHLAWSYQNSRSLAFISNCVAQNPSTGLFDKVTNELVAWTMKYETGVGGNLTVVEKYRRNRFAELVTLMQFTKIGPVSTGLISHENSASIAYITKLGGQLVDNWRIMSLSPKVSPKL